MFLLKRSFFILSILSCLIFSKSAFSEELRSKLTRAIESGNLEKRNSGEMIRFHAPMIIVEFGKIVFGFCSDWSIIG